MPREYTKMKHLEATVFEMKDAGKTNAQIGEELGLTKAQIKGLVKRYNRKANAAIEEDTPATVDTPPAAVKKKASTQKGNKAADSKQDSVPLDASAPAPKQSAPEKESGAATIARQKAPKPKPEKPVKADAPAVKAPQRAVAPAQPAVAEMIKAEFVSQPAANLDATPSPKDMQHALHNLQEEINTLEGTVHEIDRMWSRLEKSRKALNDPSKRQ